MPTGHGGVKRIGSPKAIDKSGDYVTIKITLNVSPDNDWGICFVNPSTFKPNEAHPRRVQFSGSALIVRYPKRRIKEYLEQLDNYIDQANECYRRKMAEKEAERKREEEKETKKKEELDEINKMLEELQ